MLKVKTPQDQVGGALAHMIFLLLPLLCSDLWPPLLQDCPICMDPLGGPAGYVGPQTGSSARADMVVRLAECGHVQHLGCLLAHYNASYRDGR